MDVAALVFNWALWGILALTFSLSIVWPKARLSRMPITRNRWICAGLLVAQSAQMFNLYNDGLQLHARWAPWLFVASAPWFATAIIMDIVRLRQQPAAGPPPAAPDHRRDHAP